MEHIDIQKLIQHKVETNPKSLEAPTLNHSLPPAHKKTLFDDLEKLIRNLPL